MNSSDYIYCFLSVRWKTLNFTKNCFGLNKKGFNPHFQSRLTKCWLKPLLTPVNRLLMWPRWDLNPHALSSTSPSSWQVYRFSTWPINQKSQAGMLDILVTRLGLPSSFAVRDKLLAQTFWSKICDPTGARTQDPIIKSDVLYRLSYRVFDSK